MSVTRRQGAASNDEKIQTKKQRLGVGLDDNERVTGTVNCEQKLRGEHSTTDRGKQTQTETDRHRQTQTDTDRHRQTDTDRDRQTDTYRHQQTHTDKQIQT